MSKKSFITSSLLCIYITTSCTVSHLNVSYFKSHLEEIELTNSDSIIILHRGKVLITEEEGESGDYINVHMQYYVNNKLKFYKRVSKFFNSLCSDGVVIESEEYDIVGLQKKLRQWTLKDEYGNVIDSVGCQFPYRYPFELKYMLNE